jgi:hypothetical protein
MVITAICSESTVISASLAQIQSLLLQRQDLSRVWASRTELPAVLDQAVTGCMLIFSCLDAEIQRITGGSTQNAALRRWRPRLRMMWSESQLNDLLSSIRGQQTAMTLLIQLLQMYVLEYELGRLDSLSVLADIDQEHFARDQRNIATERGHLPHVR